MGIDKRLFAVSIVMIKRIAHHLARNRSYLTLAAETFVARVVAAFGTLILSLALARTVGSRELGLFMLGYALLVGFGVATRFGLDQAMLRFGSIAVDSKNTAKFAGLRRFGWGWVSINGVLGATLLFVLAKPIAIHVYDKPDLANILRVICWALPFYNNVFLQSAWFKSLGRPALAPLFENGAISLLATGFVLVAIKAGLHLDAVWVAAIFAGAAAVMALAGRMRLEQVTAQVLPVGQGREGVPSGIARILPDFMLIAVTGYLVQWGVLAILGVFVSASDVGIYSIVQRLALIVSFVLVVFNAVLAPRVAALYSKGELAALQEVVSSTVLYVTAIALVLTLALTVGGSVFLSLFGADFTRGITALLLLSLAQLVNVATGSVGVLLNMTGNQHAMRNSVLIGGAILLVLAVVLSPLYGMNGMAAANAAGMVLQNVLAAFLVYRYLGIRSTLNLHALSCAIVRSGGRA